MKLPLQLLDTPHLARGLGPTPGLLSESGFRRRSPLRELGFVHPLTAQQRTQLAPRESAGLHDDAQLLRTAPLLLRSLGLMAHALKATRLTQPPGERVLRDTYLMRESIGTHGFGAHHPLHHAGAEYITVLPHDWYPPSPPAWFVKSPASRRPCDN
jgi:hypothetical protein